MAASLVGRPISFVNADVALDGEPVIGSFTIDGLTFAVTEGSDVELVGVAEAEGAFGSEAPTSPQPPSASTPEAEGLASGADGSSLVLPGSVTYGDAEYVVASIGAYAFYLSGVTSVELPASVTDVDERAFCSSDVSSVEVAEGNPAYSSFDGVLYDADQSSLLLIPEGRLGAVRMPSTVMAVLPSAFSHCAGVDAITVDADGAAFASENGLLYDASLETLLRVPAGATDITIREGCATIAAGAMEGCAKLSTITAPASVTSISPDVFTSVPTVSLPAATLVEDAPQLSAMVALSSADDDLPDVDPAAIEVILVGGFDGSFWEALGFALAEEVVANASHTVSYAAEVVTSYLYPNGGTWEPSPGTPDGSQFIYNGNWTDFSLVGPTVTYRVISGAFAGEMPKRTVKRDGYGFLGWGTSADAITYSYSLTYAQAQSRNWWAIWGNLYTILFDTQGGGEFAPIDAIEGAEYVLPSPSRSGYVFMGWDTQADGRGTRYQAGEGVKNLTDEAGATVTLYAQWTLSYDLTLPICDPSEITFKVDATTGDVSAVGETANADGVHHDGIVSSSMAVPVALSSVSLEALKAEDGSYGLAAIFPGDDPLAKAKLTLESDSSSASVAFGGSTSGLSNFVVPAVQDGGQLGLRYGLELAEGVGPGDIATDTGEAAMAVGKLTYTADVIGGIASVYDFFTLDDGQAGRVLDAELIKRDADHIAALHGTDTLGSDATYLKYKAWLASDHRFYAKWNDGRLYEIRLIGINHDDRADGSGKAGLTFQFVGMLAPHDTDQHGINAGYRASTTVTAQYGWGRTELRARMNPNDDPLVSTFSVENGADDNAIWNLVPVGTEEKVALRDVLVSVRKNYYAAAAGGTITGNDKLFVASYVELKGTTFADGNSYSTLNVEGTQYEFWAQPGAATHLKRNVGWWVRSYYPNLKYLISIFDESQVSHPDMNVSFGTVPCFAI